MDRSGFGNAQERLLRPGPARARDQRPRRIFEVVIDLTAAEEEEPVPLDAAGRPLLGCVALQAQSPSCGALHEGVYAWRAYAPCPTRRARRRLIRLPARSICT